MEAYRAACCAGTIIAVLHHHPLAIIDAGNAGMASGGMAMSCPASSAHVSGQKFTPWRCACVDAARRAADYRSAGGARGMLATDLYYAARIANP